MSFNSELQSREDLPATSYYVDAVAFSPDGRILASCHTSSPEFLKLWDVASGKQLYNANWSDLNEKFWSSRWDCDTLFFSPDGSALTVGGFIWDLAQGDVVNNVRILQIPFDRSSVQRHGAAVSPDLQIGVTNNTYLYDNPKTIKLWETSTRQELHTFFLVNKVEDTYKVRDVYINQFSPNGNIFASLIYIRFDLVSDQPTRYRPFYEKIQLWEVATGREICSILLPYVTAYTKYLGVLAFSPDSRILASNCGDASRRIIVLSDTETGEELCRSQDGWRIVSLAFSPNNQLLASCDCRGEITLWDLKKDGLQALIINPIRTFTSHYRESIKALAFSPDGRTLVSGLGHYGGGMTLWDVNSGRILKTFPGHRVSRRQLSSSFTHPHDIAISPDGNTIASIDDDRSIIKLWHIQNGVYLHCLKYNTSFPSHISQIAFSQNSRFLVGILTNVIGRPSRILMWEVATGKVIQSIPYFKKRTETSFILNQDGSLLAVVEIPKKSNKRNEIKVLQVLRDYHQHRISVRKSTFISKFNNFLRRLFNPKSLLIPTICKLPYKYPWEIIFSPDKQLVAIRSESEFEIREITTGELIRIINIENSQDDTDSGEFVSALFSSDGGILVVSKLRNITLWEVSSGEQICIININRPHWFTRLAFSSDGRTLAFTETTWSQYNTIKLWDVEINNEVCIVEVTSREVISLNFTGNGEFLVSSYSDGTIAVCRRNLQNINH